MLSTNDRAMAALGILIVLIALAGTMIQEGEAPEGESISFQVNFSEKSEDILNEHDRTNEGQTTTIDLNVTHQNITGIDFNLRWQDDRYPPGGDPNDDFELTITAPDDTEVEFDPSSSHSSTSEDILIIAKLQDLPKDRLKEPGESKEALAEKFITNIGTGIWNIEVRCKSAGDTNPFGFPPINDDNGNDWDLTVTLHYYKATIKKSGIPGK